jgi:hypothetical protein
MARISAKLAARLEDFVTSSMARTRKKSSNPPQQSAGESGHDPGKESPRRKLSQILGERWMNISH